MRELSKVRIRSYLILACVSSAVSTVISYFFFDGDISGVINGTIIGFLAPLFISPFTSLAGSRWAQKIPLLFMLILMDLGVMLILFILSVLSFYITNFSQEYATGQDYMFSLGLGIILSGIFTTGLMITSLVGRQELISLLSGRYLRPKTEHRIFLFMDLRNSTGIAEQLGSKDWLDFLNFSFATLSEAIILSKAQIYKYVGDEVILTWRLKNGYVPGGTNPVMRFYQNAMKEIKRQHPYFQKRWGIVPQFKIGVHAGEIVTGQLGNLKREITFLGDVVNTASRILDAGKDSQYTLTISEIIYGSLSSHFQAKFSELGETTLRGKAEKVYLFGCID